MEIEIDLKDLMEFISGIPQCLVKIGSYKPMCGDNFEFKGKPLAIHCLDFLMKHKIKEK